jgi:putative spermidine/putrescine transport system ATP-binding protein
MRTEIRRLHQSLGLTTVYVTHDQEEALSMADRLVVLRAGRVQQVGTPEELHARPANWHVADFMGYRNMLRMRVASVDGDGALATGNGLRVRGTAQGALKVGDEVVAGVRAEDLRLDPAATDGIPAVVEVVEYQGREFAVEARTASGPRLHLRTTQRLAPDDSVTLTADPTRVLLFPLGDGALEDGS